jgi:transcriptional regulator with XRE-family HTH domain
MQKDQAADMALAAALRGLRTRKGRELSQETVAQRAGITLNSYARIELGQASPAWATVRQIAKALGVSMVELARAVERAS